MTRITISGDNLKIKVDEDRCQWCGTTPSKDGLCPLCLGED